MRLFTVIFGLLIFILIAHLVGAFGSLFTISEIPTWYATLALPSWSPPSEVFAPVWLTLYTFMGVAAYMVFNHRKTRDGVGSALTLYAIQLVLNGAWSVIFFGFHMIGLAFAEILLLAFFVGLTTIRFWRISASAGVLMLIYLGWVLFAAALNFGIWWVN